MNESTVATAGVMMALLGFRLELSSGLLLSIGELFCFFFFNKELVLLIISQVCKS